MNNKSVKDAFQNDLSFIRGKAQSQESWRPAALKDALFLSVFVFYQKIVI